MITKIKQLADEALALQNKNRMDEVLREISAMCEVKDPLSEKSMMAEIAKIPSDMKIVKTGSKGVKCAK